MITRRSALWLGGAALALAALPRPARAMARTPTGGVVRVSLPWALDALDPHDLSDPAAALFGAAIADSLFALDASGQVYPTLADALPTQQGQVTTVRLRAGLRSARGLALDARDVAFSIARARARGALAILAEVPVPKLVRGDALALSFAGPDPLTLARTLASPLVALVPRGFSPAKPDGTGAFRADVDPGRLILARNDAAARGPAFLERVEVARASDLKTSLRAFEAERDDIGWLGAGLFGERRGATSFDFGGVGWVVLRVGPDAGAFGMPGVAQQIVDAIPSARLAYLGLGAAPAASTGSPWGGPPSDLCVDASSVHLVEVARAVAAAISRPGHEVTVRPLQASEIARRRAQNKLTLAIDLVRPLGPGPLLTMAALATADDPARARDIVRHPPRLAPGVTARALTSTLRVGVIGELRVTGGVSAGLALVASPAGGWELGASHRVASP